MEDKETEKPTETKILIGEIKKEMEKEKEKEKSVERSFLKITHHLFFEKGYGNTSFGMLNLKILMPKKFQINFVLQMFKSKSLISS